MPKSTRRSKRRPRKTRRNSRNARTPRRSQAAHFLSPNQIRRLRANSRSSAGGNNIVSANIVSAFGATAAPYQSSTVMGDLPTPAGPFPKFLI